LFVVQSAKNDAGQARLGMAVGLRAARSAACRNRLRRLVRESFRLHRQELPPVDVLVTARATAAMATNREVFESLARIWQAIGAAR
jgi:ribonuclease P protein component